MMSRKVVSDLKYAQKMRPRLDEFVDRTQAAGIRAISHVDDHGAGLRSFELFADVFRT
ncbi:MAG TPA: hypothetical protein VGE15_05050 [Sphingobacteriaceae bacterium]